MAVVPDPVTCFSTARYSQKQVFKVVSDSSLVIVDWITSGRHESGEKWDFDLYKSTNHIFLEDDQPLFLDTVMLFFLFYSVFVGLVICCCLFKIMLGMIFFNNGRVWKAVKIPFYWLSVLRTMLRRSHSMAI